MAACSSKRCRTETLRRRCCCGKAIGTRRAGRRSGRLANLSKLPRRCDRGLKALLKGGTVIGTGPGELEIERSLPHGHVAAALGMIRKLALDRLILSTAKDAVSRRHCDLVVAMMVDRLIAPRSKLGFVRAVDEETAASSLGEVLHLGRVKEREAYEALDWLLERQVRIENGLARRHLKDGVLVLYDVSSSYFEGRCCPLAQYGHSRDHRGDRPQIVYGLLCTREGLPIAVEVFDGNTADPTTLSSQVEKAEGSLRDQPAGAGRGPWDDHLGPDPRRSQACGSRLDHLPARAADPGLWRKNGPLQLSLFDERDLAEISSPDFPGRAADRVPQPRSCRRARPQARGAAGRDRTGAGPDPGADPPQEASPAQRRRDRPGGRRGRRRQENGQALRPRHPRRPLSLASARSNRSPPRPGSMASMSFAPACRRSTRRHRAVQAYKDLSRVERAFRSMKTVDLEIRPIRHWTADRVRAHVFLCMLAYHVEWHLRQALAPLLFHDTDLDAARAERASPVATTEPSEAVKAKKATKRNANGDRVIASPASSPISAP